MSDDPTSGATVSPATHFPAAIMRTEPELVPARGGRRSGTLHRLLGIGEALAALTAGALATGQPIDSAFEIGAICVVLVPS